MDNDDFDELVEEITDFAWAKECCDSIHLGRLQRANDSQVPIPEESKNILRSVFSRFGCTEDDFKQLEELMSLK